MFTFAMNIIEDFKYAFGQITFEGYSRCDLFEAKHPCVS